MATALNWKTYLAQKWSNQAYENIWAVNILAVLGKIQSIPALLADKDCKLISNTGVSIVNQRLELGLNAAGKYFQGLMNIETFFMQTSHSG